VTVVTELSFGKIFEKNGHETGGRELLVCPQTESIVLVLYIIHSSKRLLTGTNVTVLTNFKILDRVIENFH
jgi:hypothetical protein